MAFQHFGWWFFWLELNHCLSRIWGSQILPFERGSCGWDIICSVMWLSLWIKVCFFGQMVWFFAIKISISSLYRIARSCQTSMAHVLAVRACLVYAHASPPKILALPNHGHDQNFGSLWLFGLQQVFLPKFWQNHCSIWFQAKWLAT